ncbi:CPBP family intramembrane glutamic endopeptidase [Streptococcus ruminantium]|uniref:Type II CAAX endopeptidase family protein n=1 Tax=Streptococcus ruminantium TaxID=1917441 RepID=A0ABU1B3B9_9STRE|nr:type II CAAX endopeptidase family protein [Streptococcus ruminantium]MDQ8758932.1 type II CAAX endopeptidase family protein [Streptococcus ruminantium]MDQ8768762.1 type II CAAX endopeptidase family protein [Streptococcus ruminantium]MDQ8774232.1 type II CAAX endopeptidase family protein [Streptococcus ruminantium]MDQ8794049.1 type II CAAX endopeptidase family protein [Streptococcus ruminantium]MDQ8795429.1 type II CAAX endopeptidase family protein [Streptococcus ruminantium]
MKKITTIMEWNVVKNWKYLLTAVAVLALNILTQRLVFSLPNFNGPNLFIAAALLLFAVAIGLWSTKILGLWQSEKKWSLLEAFGFLSIGFVVLFGVKMIGGQLIVIEEGYGKTPANQELIQNSGLPVLLLFIFTVFFAPVLEELLFRGIIMGKVFGKDSILGLLLSSYLFGLIHGPTNIGSWVLYAGIGLVLGIIYRLSGKYSYALILHFVNNLIGIGLLLLLQSLGAI